MKHSKSLLSLILFLTLSAPLSAQDKYAVLVGVEVYDPGSFKNLKFTEDDADRLGQILKSHGYQTTVMTSRSESAQLQPYKAENILRAIRTRANSCVRGDTLIVSLSGHGIQLKNDPLLASGVKETYFCPADANFDDKSTLVPISQVMELINQSQASRKLLLVDACRNEVVSRAGQNKSSSARIELDSVHENRQSVPGGMSVLFSCSSKQKSWESNELERSVFSHFVTEYLDGNADERYYDNGHMTLDDLVTYVRKKTNDYVFESNLSSDGQFPVRRGESANWALARTTALESYEDTEVDTLIRHAKLGITRAQAEYGSRLADGEGIACDLNEAMFWLDKAAAKGDMDAVTNVGYIYDEQGDFARAITFYTRAAEADHAIANYNLGVAYRDGKGVSEDLDKAYDYFRRAADLGDVDALNSVGWIHELRNEFRQALDWYEKGAQAEVPLAMDNLGRLQIHGIGTDVDYESAEHWCRQAAEAGLETAQCNLGFLLYEQQKYEEAFDWYLRAAEQDCREAMFTVGLMKIRGEGTDQDATAGVEWMRRGAQLGDPDCQMELGRVYMEGELVPADHFEAMMWFRRSAKQANSDAMVNIGFMYDTGLGVGEDKKEAVKWYRQAAEEGNATGQCNLGICFANGEGVDVDIDEARKWFKKAAAQGHETAQTELANLGDQY